MKITPLPWSCVAILALSLGCGSNDNDNNNNNNGDDASASTATEDSSSSTSIGGSQSASSGGSTNSAASDSTTGTGGTITGAAGDSATNTASSTGGAEGSTTGEAGSSNVGGETSTSDTSTTGGVVVVDGSLFTVEVQLASDVEESAPGTVGIVTWSTTTAPVVDAHIEFGLDTDYGMNAPVDLNEADYRTLLLGMKPSNTYHFRVVASDGTVSYASDDYTVETGPPTDAVSIGNFNVVDPDGREPGFIVGSYWQGSTAGVAFILDADGEIVWWHDFGVMGIARARMSADGKNMWMISSSNNGGPLQRVSMDTLDGQTYPDTVGSHDITPVAGETMAYLDYGETDCDSIFLIDPSGATEEVFESNDFLQPAGCHGNALRYSQAEDVFTFSDVQQDILVVDRQGGLQWRVSEILSGGVASYGGRQHGHHLLSDSILIFANVGGGNMISTAVEYTLTGEEIFNYESGDYTDNLGDVQRLPGGNTLVTFSNDSIVHEVDANGNVVMEFDGAGFRIGYLLWRESLYGLPPDLTD